MKAHKNFLRNQTPLTKEVGIQARNRYNKTVNDVKEKFSEHMRHKILSGPNGSRAFWSLAKHVKNSFTDFSFLPLTADDGTIITSSIEKAQLFAKTFAANSTLNRPTNLELPTVPEVTQYASNTQLKQSFKNALVGLDLF